MPPQTPKSNPTQVQIALSLAVFLVPFTGSSLNLALPQIAAEFSMSAFLLTFIVSLYLAASAMGQMPAARAADLIGRRKLFLLGLALFAVFSLASAFAWSGTVLILCRFLAGVASALVFATNMAILTAVFPKEKRGQALGVNTAVVYLSFAIGPVLGGLLAHYYGWRSILLVTTAITLAAIAASVLAIKDEWKVAAGEPYDKPGAALYTVTVAALIFGFTFIPGHAGWGLLALALLGLYAFVKTELATAAPMLKLNLFLENRHFRLAALSAMINYAAAFAIGFILSLYLQSVRGLDTRAAGLILISQPIVQTFAALFGGWLSDRINPSILTTLGMGMIMVGLLLLALLTPTTPVYFIVLVLILIGLGFGLFSPPNSNLIMGSVSQRDSSTASATTGTARQIGQALSIAITSLVVHHYMGDQPLTTETAGLFLPAIRTAFLLFAAICLAGCYTSASKLMGGKEAMDWKHVSGRLPVLPPENADAENNTDRGTKS